MKYICSTVNTTYGCNTCPHGKLHDPVDSRFTLKDGKKIPIGKCNEDGGTCYEGYGPRWPCKCLSVMVEGEDES